MDFIGKMGSLQLPLVPCPVAYTFCIDLAACLGRVLLPAESRSGVAVALAGA